MSIQAAVDAYQKYDKTANDRIHIWMAAGTPRGSPLTAHKDIGKAAKSHAMGLTMHCAEAPKDLAIYREQYQCSPFQFCRDTQLTGEKSVFAHVVHPDPGAGDYEILRESKSTVSHNPTSNLKLGSGISPIPDMVAAGVNVALGTDGAPCNNTYDMFREMHLASILHDGVRQRAGTLNAHEILEFATINGARALGLEEHIGSLAVGKKADMVIVAPKGVKSAPWDAAGILSGGLDPVTVLVHCSGSYVDSVLVDGQVLVREGELLTVDETEVVSKAKEAAVGIRSRSGVCVRNHMSLKYV